MPDLQAVVERSVPYTLWFALECSMRPDGGPRYLLVESRFERDHALILVRVLTSFN